MRAKLCRKTMVLALAFALALPLGVIFAYAQDYKTADELAEAVSNLNVSDEDYQSKTDALVTAAHALSSAEKRRLAKYNASAIDRLAGHYKQAYNRSSVTDEAKVGHNDNFSSSSRMPDDSYAYGAAVAVQAGESGSVNLYIEQEKAKSGTTLQFTVDLNGSHSLAVPIVLHVAVPKNFSTKYDYYIRSDNETLECTIRHERLVFATPELGQFRVIREKSDSKDDDDYEISSFWEDVIDDIYDARSGDRIRVDAGKRTTVPADVLRELKGKAVTLSIRRTNADTITIYGKDIRSVPSTRDYYTMKTLASLYRSGTEESSSVAQSSQPQPPPAPAPAPAPVVVQPIAPAVPTPAPVSSAASSSAPDLVSEPQESDIDTEIVAEEDEPFDDLDEQPSKPQEPTGAQESDARALGWFAISVTLGAVLVSAGITLAVWLRGRRWS